MSRLLLCSLTITALGLTACAVDDNVGNIEINLRGQAPSGTIYRLRNAQLTLTGPGGSQTFQTEQDPDRTTINTRVDAGQYTLSLATGWRLERVPVGGPAVTVPATLLSPDPLPIVVIPGVLSPALLRFLVSEGAVGMGKGDVGISIDVDEVHVVTSTNTLGTIPENQSVTFTLRLSGPPAGSILVSLTSSDPSAATVGPSTISFDSSNFANPQTVTVTIPVDPDIDDETFTITAALPGSAGAATITGTVDDLTPIRVFGHPDASGRLAGISPHRLIAQRMTVSDSPVTLVRLRILAQSAGLARMAIYNNIPFTDAPGDLIAASATEPFDLLLDHGAGINVVLQPGSYWLAFVLDRLADIEQDGISRFPTEKQCEQFMSFGGSFPQTFPPFSSCLSTSQFALNISALGF